MQKFMHIGSLAQACKYVEVVNGNPAISQYHVVTPVTFRGTVKLHGSNMGVRCTPSALVPQSREVELVDQDSCGFRTFVQGEAQAAAIRTIERMVRKDHDIPTDKAITLYGEWCGPGVQQGVAVSNLPSKQWVLFAIRDEDGNYIDGVPTLGDGFKDSGIFSIMDGPVHYLKVDFGDAESLSSAESFLTGLTEDVEKACPWAKRFGITGTGEGLVWVPLGDFWGREDLAFKTKGQKHKVKVERKVVSVDLETVESVNDFVDMMVTENRLQQGLDVLRQQGLPISAASTGAFLGWFNKDVEREGADDLNANGLTWKDVSKEVTSRARAWWFKQFV